MAGCFSGCLDGLNEGALSREMASPVMIIRVESQALFIL